MDTHDEEKMRVVNVRVQARSDVPQSDGKYPAAVTQCGGFSPASTVMLNTMGLNAHENARQTSATILKHSRLADLARPFKHIGLASLCVSFFSIASPTLTVYALHFQPIAVSVPVPVLVPTPVPSYTVVSPLLYTTIAQPPPPSVVYMLPLHTQSC
ncbi:hypothetical protein E4U44_007487 [Claviceps purpurea]|nr:hypothetical protein E4U44_007487 [Claviceps purpurea]